MTVVAETWSVNDVEIEVYDRVPLIVYCKDNNGREVQMLGGFALHIRRASKVDQQPTGDSA